MEHNESAWNKRKKMILFGVGVIFSFGVKIYNNTANTVSKIKEMLAILVS